MQGEDLMVSFAADVRLFPDHHRLVVHRAPRSHVLRGLPSAASDLLLELARGCRPLSEVTAAAARPAGFARVLDRLSYLLVRDLRAPDGRTLLRIEPLRPLPLSPPASIAPETAVRLSRFALLRAEDGTVVLESPRSGARLRLVDEVARSVVLHLARPRSCADLRQLTDPSMPDDAVAGLVGVLVGLGFAAANDDPALRQWEFHDALFAARTSPERPGLPRFLNELPAPPAVRPYPADAARIPLHRPSLDALLRRDPPLTTALESRRSFTRYGSTPVSAEDLGEFLYRTARTRSRLGERPGLYYQWDSRPLFERTSRPYPSIDGLHELELYVSIGRCAGLSAGTYYYAPVEHALIPVDQVGDQMLSRITRWHQAGPDVLVTVISRMGRLSWNYGSIAYSLTLQHLGVLYQTMYLVATAMGLAPCALRGVAEPEAVTEALGLDGVNEVVVGEFLLGTLPDDEPGPNGWEPVNDAEWAHPPRDSELTR